MMLIETHRRAIANEARSGTIGAMKAENFSSS
jgi:hypothetical protein